MSDYKKHNHHCDENCDCEKSKHHYPHVSIGKIVTKVPVVLAELDLQVDITHTTDFSPDQVVEIKDVKRRLVITQCRLLLPTNKLFIKGFVRKNIQYAGGDLTINRESPINGSIGTDLRSRTEHIPFELITEIKDFISKPVLPEKNKRQEFDFMVAQQLPVGFPEKDELISSDLSQFHQESSQFYNELPYCDLISSNVVEWSEAVNRMPRDPSIHSEFPLGEGTFNMTEDKMVIYFKVKVLQNQQIRVTSTTNDHHDWDDCDI